MSRSLLLASALLLAPVLAPTPASAQDFHSQDVRSQVVPYGDLDLNYAPDAHRMVHRIHHAARNVCESGPGVQTIDDQRDETNCRVDAEERGVADTGSSQVAQAYYGREPQVIVGENDEPAPLPYEDPYAKKY